MGILRLLQDPPLPGALNMARDEALLTRVGEGSSPPTLRFYEWGEPTISLGYFQQYRDYETLPPPAGRLPVVRRLTGGGAILHDRELTYSLTLPARHPLVAHRPNHLYELVHDTLIEFLLSRGVNARRAGAGDDSGPRAGPFFCFARQHCLDVFVGSDKLCGSAQRRTHRAILQHGSIVLERRFDQQPCGQLATEGIDSFVLRRDFAERLLQAIGLPRVDTKWMTDEITVAGRLTAKYVSDAWNKRT